MLDHLTGLYCKHDMKVSIKIITIAKLANFLIIMLQLFSYVADVLVTEAMVHLIAKFCGLKLDEVYLYLIPLSLAGL